MNHPLTHVGELPPFEYRWPATTAQFTGGWHGRVASGSRTLQIEHAIGARDVYGHRRAHTVTFVNGQPSVEGVAADDFERSRALLSLIKLGAGHVLAKEPSQIPVAYRDLEIVSHRNEIDAPYSKRCLALKIAIDDLDTWTRHALQRFEAQGR